jgi:hypothetical protein
MKSSGMYSDERMCVATLNHITKEKNRLEFTPTVASHMNKNIFCTMLII